MEVIIDSFEVLRELCKAKNMWGMYVSINMPEDKKFSSPDEMCKAALWLNELDDVAIQQIWFYQQCYLFFDNEADMITAYDFTKGDDGPTQANPYNGPVNVYAVTCNPVGQLLNENT